MLEREFSQGESQSSRASSSQSSEKTVRQSSEVTIAESSPDERLGVSREEMPAGTVYFSDGQFFQDFSGFQKQNFQSHFQHSHFRNESHPQEQVFSTSFLEPASQQTLL